MASRLGWAVAAIAAMAAISLAIYFGCDRPPPPVPQPLYNPSGESSKAIELFDANNDGKISGKELDKCPGLKASLKVLKTDKDMGITKEMIAERVGKWIESRIGRTSLSCMVTRNGQPLAGANVRFVPEPFLSDALKEVATGETNPTGMAMISLPVTPGPDALPPGIPPGMYCVEITKAGENIPAIYNTATTLGQEVSLDNLDMQMGIRYQLKY